MSRAFLYQTSPPTTYCIRRSLACNRSVRRRAGFEAMEERDCQFLVPPTSLQYDEDHVLHQQLVMVGGDQHDPAGGPRMRRGRGGGGGGGERKRRFTEEQVRSLETTFHARRAKLEPREKAELARELGLQPRQVAIWFQNKRARWRSKQLEHDHAELRARYDALRDRVESLRQEKRALAARVDELKGRGQDQSGTSSCDEIKRGGAAPVLDDRRNNNYSVSSQLLDDTGMAPVAVTTSSDDSAAAPEYYDHDHVAYCEGLPDPFCNPPELWDSWPLLEWNAVA